MRDERSFAYVSLWIFALAFGVIEAAVVVYLREVHLRELALHGGATLTGLQVTLVSLPDALIRLEIVREACTILLLAACAWLAGRQSAERAGAFLLAFGVWDLTYYAVLKLATDWPGSLRTWDILFLIPLPWVAPVWAPMTVAVLFVAAGTYLFWTPARIRIYRWHDAVVFSSAAALTIAAFLVRSAAATERHPPEHFPVALFWAGVVAATVWFLVIERRAPSGAQAPWLHRRGKAAA